MSDDLMTVPEVAAELGLSRAQAYAIVARGEIPSLRLSPRRTRIPRRALDAYLRLKAIETYAARSARETEEADD